MPNVECMPEAPGYMDALPDSTHTMAYLADYLALDTSEIGRFKKYRWVNTDKYGSYNQYYSSYDYWVSPTTHKVTNVPSGGPGSGYQNAVVFWPIYRGQIARLVGTNAEGYTWADTSHWPTLNPDHFAIPNRVWQCVIRTDIINDYKNKNPFYVNQQVDSAWINDRRILVKALIAHEFGHNIGMLEGYTNFTNTSTLMRKTKFDSNNGDRIFTTPPEFIPEYSDTSKAEITIKEKKPWAR